MTDTRRGGVVQAALFLIALCLLIGVLNFFWMSREVHAASARAQALCQFDADLGAAPITIPPAGRPSVLGVTIISDARTAWRKAGCPGWLPAPDPTFTRWARVYRLPAG